MNIQPFWWAWEADLPVAAPKLGPGENQLKMEKNEAALLTPNPEIIMVNPQWKRYGLKH
jgi:hypothetical protein